MAYINKGSLVKVNGRLAVAVSNDYTKMVYDAYDAELFRAGYEGGTAEGYVDVSFSDTLKRVSFPLSQVEKV